MDVIVTAKVKKNGSPLSQFCHSLVSRPSRLQFLSMFLHTASDQKLEAGRPGNEASSAILSVTQCSPLLQDIARAGEILDEQARTIAEQVCSLVHNQTYTILLKGRGESAKRTGGRRG